VVGYFVAVIVCVVELGFLAGDVAFGAMVSMHAASVCFLESRWLQGSRFRTRLFLSVCTSVAVWCLVYIPLLQCVERYWVVPLRTGNQVAYVWLDFLRFNSMPLSRKRDQIMIVQRGVPVESLKRGDWVGFRIDGNRSVGEHNARLMLRGGLFINQVLALAGDEVQFSNQTVFVNGKALPAAPHMPAKGGFVVPEKEWFFWPNLDINNINRVPGADISATMLEAAMVKENQIIGRAYDSWFGRRQLP